MTQPTFVPFADTQAVRASIPTPAPETNRPKKPGLLGAPHAPRVAGQGATGPDGGYALTVTARYIRDHHIHDDAVSHHDLEVAVAAVAAKRASLYGRGPSLSDVEVAFGILGVTSSHPHIATHIAPRLAGLGHSYFALRAFVDTVSDDALRVAPADARALA